MDFPETYTMQDQAQIPYIIKQLRWDKTVANDILVTLDHLQLISGLVTPILQNTTTPIKYIDDSFLISISDINKRIDMDIESVDTPPATRGRHIDYGPIHTNPKNHHGYAEKGQHSPNIPSGYHNSRPLKP